MSPEPRDEEGLLVLREGDAGRIADVTVRQNRRELALRDREDGRVVVGSADGVDDVNGAVLGDGDAGGIDERGPVRDVVDRAAGGRHLVDAGHALDAPAEEDRAAGDVEAPRDGAFAAGEHRRRSAFGLDREDGATVFLAARGAGVGDVERLAVARERDPERGDKAALGDDLGRSAAHWNRVNRAVAARGHAREVDDRGVVAQGRVEGELARGERRRLDHPVALRASARAAAAHVRAGARGCRRRCRCCRRSYSPQCSPRRRALRALPCPRPWNRACALLTTNVSRGPRMQSVASPIRLTETAP